MDIRALAEKGYDIAKGIADQAWKPITLRLDPDRDSYDPISDTLTTGWNIEIQVEALKYNEQKMVADTSLSVDRDIFLVKAIDTGYVDIDTRAEIEFDGTKYGIDSIEVDPVAATYKFIMAR